MGVFHGSKQLPLLSVTLSCKERSPSSKPIYDGLMFRLPTDGSLEVFMLILVSARLLPDKFAVNGRLLTPLAFARPRSMRDELDPDHMPAIGLTCSQKA